MSTIQGGAFPVYAWQAQLPPAAPDLLIDAVSVGTVDLDPGPLWGYGPTGADAVHDETRVIGYVAQQVADLAAVSSAVGRVRVGASADTTAGHPRPILSLTLAASASTVELQWPDPAVARLYGIPVSVAGFSSLVGAETEWSTFGSINGAGYWAPSSIVAREEQDLSIARETRATPFSTPDEDGDGIDHVYYGEARSTEIEHDFVEAANVFLFRAENQLFASRAGRNALDRSNLLEQLLDAGARGHTIRIYRAAGQSYQPARIVSDAARSVRGIAQRVTGAGVRYRCLVPLRLLVESP